MPTDSDNGTGNVGLPPGYIPPKRPLAPIQLASPLTAAARAPAAVAAPVMTPEQQAAQAQQQALITGSVSNGGYVAPGTIAAIDPTKPTEGQATQNRVNAGIATGNLLAGEHQYDDNLFAQDAVHQNLSVGEAQAQRQRDFGLGSNNNAQTAAMLGQAQATGDKYSAAFGNVAGSAGANAAAAGARGTAMYGGDLSQFGQGLANAQQARGLQTGSFDALMQFAGGPQGASAAQAQLRQATDANTQNALAMARSGRGMGGGQAAMRQALAQNAGTQQQASNQAAELRANEYTAFKAQQLNALNAAGGLAGQVVQGDQNYGQLGLAGAQYQTDAALKGTQLNDAAAQGWATQQQNAIQQGLGAEVGAQTQGLNINSTALTGRENEYASANQTAAMNKGLAQAASIADANRTQAYTGAALQTGGTLIGALSDERYKTNIQPLSIVQPKAGTGSVQGAQLPQLGPAPKGPSTGETVGKVGGSVAGTAAGSAVAGPIGGIVGSALGGAIGSSLGKVFSDVRSKTNIEPLSAGGGLSASGEYLHGNAAAGRRTMDPSPFPGRQLDSEDPFATLAREYGAGGVASSSADVAKYAGSKAEAKFAKSDHPILSEGDALLADSARSIPGSTYEYKDPTEPGAKPGRQVGPMAQDLAANPLTQNTVIKDPTTGKLSVDAPRLTLYNTAQQHGQQNQLDDLNIKIAKLEGLLKRKPGDEKPTSFERSTGGL